MAVVALTLIGWGIVLGVVWVDEHAVSEKQLAAEGLKGISPAIQACYLYRTRSSPAVIAFALGIAMGFSYVFATYLYERFRRSAQEARTAFWGAVSGTIAVRPRSELIGVTNEYREFEKLLLDRRNIFASLFARVGLAIIVVCLISLLISTCKIESQAGLPIISGIIAFIIGQGSELVHAAGSPVITVGRGSPEPPQQDERPR